MGVEKTLKNSCGHSSRYTVEFSDYGVDIESDVNGLCDVCTKEDSQFKAQIAEVFQKGFD